MIVPHSHLDMAEAVLRVSREIAKTTASPQAIGGPADEIERLIAQKIVKKFLEVRAGFLLCVCINFGVVYATRERELDLQASTVRQGRSRKMFNPKSCTNQLCSV